MLGAIIVLSAVLLYEAVPVQAGRSQEPQVDARKSQQLHEADRHYRAGADALDRERFEEALHELGQAVKLDPDSFPAYFSLGKAYMRLQRYDDSVRAYLSCRKAWGRLVTEQMKRGFEKDLRRENSIRQYEEAIRELGSLMSTAQTDSERSSIRARIDSLRIVSDGMQRLRGGNHATPEPPAEFALALGSAYLRTGAVEDAERAYREALQLRPQYGEAHNNLAVIGVKRGDYEAAYEHVTAAKQAGFSVNPELVSQIEDARRKPRK